MQLGETDWGAVIGDVAKAAAGAYTVSSQYDLQKELVKAQTQAPYYGLPMPNALNYPISYSPQYSPAYSSVPQTGINTSAILMLGLGALAIFLLMSGDKK